MNFCPNCGSSIKENQKFCPACGFLTADYQAPDTQPEADAFELNSSSGAEREIFPEHGANEPENTFEGTPFAGSIPKAESVGYEREEKPDPFRSYQVEEAKKAGTNGYAIASLVLGLAGILFDILLAIPSILAIIFGAVGISYAKKCGSGRGMSIAGLVLGIVIIAFWLIVFLCVITFTTTTVSLFPVLF